MAARPDPRIRIVPPELTELARARFEAIGPVAAARDLGISPSTLYAVLAGRGAMPGTLALLREAAARLGTVA